MLRRFAAALVVAVATVAAIGIASPAQASNAGGFVARINAERARVGLAPLVQRADLAAIALRHAETMAVRNSLYHNRSLTAQVANWQAVGENVGMGGDVRVLHAAFMNSPAHRAIILDRDFTEIGVGVTVDPRGVMWVTEVFRQPLRSAARTSTRAVAVAVNASAGTPARKAPTRRPVTKRPATTKAPAVRWVAPPASAEPHRIVKSAWLNRLSLAATAEPARSVGALPQAVEYLRVVAG